jgi:hypothetical protein
MDLYERVDALALSSDCPATTWADPDSPFMSIHSFRNANAGHERKTATNENLMGAYITSWEGDFSANRRVSTGEAGALSSKTRSCPLRSARRDEGSWDVVPARALIH